MSSLSHRIAWNTVVQMAGKVASTTLGVLIVIILTRYLGREGYGLVVFSSVFVTLFGSVADWGMTLITVREASKNSVLAHEIIGNVLVIRLILATLAAAAAIVVIFLLPQPPLVRILVAINAITLIALSLKTSFQMIFNVKLQMQNWAISELTANGLTILLIVLFVWFRAGIVEIILAFMAGDFLAAAVAARLGYRLLPLSYSLVHKATRFLLLESLPMGAILAIFTIYNRMDTIILQYFKGSEAVGLYGVAYRVFEVLVLGAAYFANSIFPLISNLAGKNNAKLADVYRKSFVILLFLGVLVAVANYFLAPLAVAILGGQEFTASVMPLRILSLALIVSYFNHLNGYTLIALGRQWYSLAIAVIALVVNVSLNWVFIPIYSFQAAAFITFITEGLIVLLSLLVLHRQIGLTPPFLAIPAVVAEFIKKRGKIFEHEGFY